MSEKVESDLMGKYLGKSLAWVAHFRPHWLRLDVIVRELNEELEKDG